MAVASTCGSMESRMRGSGTRAENTDMGCGEALKAIRMLVSGRIASHMGSASRYHQTEISMKESGDIQLSMVKERNSFIMAIYTSAITETESLMALANISGQIKGTSKVPLSTVGSKGLESGSSMLFRQIPSCKPKSYLNMNLKAIIETITSKATEFSYGLRAPGMRGTSKMIFAMGLE
jgi:hypothetical protein